MYDQQGDGMHPTGILSFSVSENTPEIKGAYHVNIFQKTRVAKKVNLSRTRKSTAISSSNQVNCMLVSI